MWSEEWWSDAWGDGCSDSAIFSWLLLPLIVAWLACMRMCWASFSPLFFLKKKNIIMQCSIWPWKEHVPGGYRESWVNMWPFQPLRHPWVHKLATSLVTAAHRTLLIQLFLFHMLPAHCGAVIMWVGVRLKWKNGKKDIFSGIILNVISIHHLTTWCAKQYFFKKKVKIPFEAISYNVSYKTASHRNLCTITRILWLKLKRKTGWQTSHLSECLFLRMTLI